MKPKQLPLILVPLLAQLLGSVTCQRGRTRAGNRAPAAATSTAVEAEYTDECPVENGFFADAVQCDRYYECKNGKVSGLKPLRRKKQELHNLHILFFVVSY